MSRLFERILLSIGLRYVKPSPFDWHDIDAILKKTLIDGSRANGDLMRRRTPAGTWEYRKPTDDEMLEIISDWAW